MSNTHLPCFDRYDHIFETCFVQLCKNVFNVRQFVRVCTLMVKRRSSIYAWTFSRPLDLYDHYRQDNVAWIYVMSEGSFWLPNVENFGAQFRRSCTEGVCISLYLLVALQSHVLGVSILVNRKKSWFRGIRGVSLSLNFLVRFSEWSKWPILGEW